MSLRLSNDLKLPIEAVTEKLGWLGRTGSGKTYGAQKLAEEMHRAGAQFVALDPVGKWWSLRLAADGKTPALPIPVFGGLHGDIPLEPTAGKLIADVIVDRGISAVVDVSQFESDIQKARFMTDFGNRFYFRKKAAPSAVHLFIEEAQEFVPQNPQRDEATMLHAWTRMQKLGRNFGIGSSLITQRPQEVNKKVLNLTEVLFVFQLTGPQERKTVAWWIEEKGIDEDIAAELPKLQRGCPHVWSPAWLQVSKVVRISEKSTYDASSTPKVGRRDDVKELAPIDLEKLRRDMTATIERAKAEDPRELRRRITELEATLAKANAVAGRIDKKLDRVQMKEKRVEVPVLKDGQIKRIEMLLSRAEKFRDPLNNYLQKIDVVKAGLSQAASEIMRAVNAVKDSQAPPEVIHLPVRATITAHRRPVSPSKPASPPPSGDGSHLSPTQQRILDALAELEQLGAKAPERTLVALLAGYTNLASKGFVNAMSTLRTAGQIDYPSSRTVALTSSGRTVARSSERPRSSEEIQDRIIRLLGGATGRILSAVIRAYPEPVLREDVAGEAGYTNLASKGFVNGLSRLRSLGFVDYPSSKQVVAQPVLFLEG